MLQSYEKLLIHRTQTLTVKVLISGPLLVSGQASRVSCWGDGSSSQGTMLRLCQRRLPGAHAVFSSTGLRMQQGKLEERHSQKDHLQEGRLCLELQRP